MYKHIFSSAKNIPILTVCSNNMCKLSFTDIGFITNRQVKDIVYHNIYSTADDTILYTHTDYFKKTNNKKDRPEKFDNLLTTRRLNINICPDLI